MWAVTSELTRLGGHVAEALGGDVQSWQYFQEVVPLKGSPIDRADGWIVIAMLAGSGIAALWAGDFRWRVPRLKRRFVQAIIGGIVAGFGARLAYGCNLAAMFTGIPQFSLHAWLFTLTAAIGTLLGVKLIQQRWWRGPTHLVPTSAHQVTDPSAERRHRRRHLGVALLIIAGLLLACMLYVATGRAMLAVAVVFGTAFGALVQRGQICFTAAFRDLWITGRTKLADALVIGLAVATVSTFIVLLVTGMEPITKPAGLGTLIDGLLFGLGIVMAAACETGMMYRATAGQVAAWLAFGGNVLARRSSPTAGTTGASKRPSWRAGHRSICSPNSVPGRRWGSPWRSWGCGTSRWGRGEEADGPASRPPQRSRCSSPTPSTPRGPHDDRTEAPTPASPQRPTRASRTPPRNLARMRPVPRRRPSARSSTSSWICAVHPAPTR